MKTFSCSIFLLYKINRLSAQCLVLEWYLRQKILQNDFDGFQIRKHIFFFWLRLETFFIFQREIIKFSVFRNFWMNPIFSIRFSPGKLICCKCSEDLYDLRLQSDILFGFKKKKKHFKLANSFITKVIKNWTFSCGNTQLQMSNFFSFCMHKVLFNVLFGIYHLIARKEKKLVSTVFRIFFLKKKTANNNEQNGKFFLLPHAKMVFEIK